MESSLHRFLEAAKYAISRKNEKPEEDTIAVSETVSVAASAYETLRNTLEYDEEHVLRRNAIRRICKRRLGEQKTESLAQDMLRELIWARYLPNKRVPERMVKEVKVIFDKYDMLFRFAPREGRPSQEVYEWLLDVLATEIEYHLEPPVVDEAFAAFAYQEVKKRLLWVTPLVDEADRDLQVFAAVYRAILRSDQGAMRYRLLTLYYPSWNSAVPDGELVTEVASELGTVIGTIERQLTHPAADILFRLVRRHAIVFDVLRDIVVDNPLAVAQAIEVSDTQRLTSALRKAVEARNSAFSRRLRRSVARAVLFLFCTKMIMALVIELPFELLFLKVTDYRPLLANIIFHPLLLGFLGLTTAAPKEANTEKILEEALSLVGAGEDDAFKILIKQKRPWSGGFLGFLFRAIYGAAFLCTGAVLIFVLTLLHFNSISIFFFLFFLSLVMFFGIKIRLTRRDLLVIDSGGGIIGSLLDVLFLPIIRMGRWMALRAPKVNIFLFFFDFIVEAPFKGAIRLFEAWLAFLREKKEEI